MGWSRAETRAMRYPTRDSNLECLPTEQRQWNRFKSRVSLLCIVKANSHIPCRAPAVRRQRRVLRESPHVTGKIRTANRETPLGSRKKPNLGRSSMIIHTHTMPCLCRAVPWPWEVASRHGRSTAWTQRGMCETNTVALACSSGKDTI